MIRNDFRCYNNVVISLVRASKTVIWHEKLTLPCDMYFVACSKRAAQYLNNNGTSVTNLIKLKQTEDHLIVLIFVYLFVDCYLLFSAMGSCFNFTARFSGNLQQLFWMKSNFLVGQNLQK